MTTGAEQLIRDIEDMKVKGAYLITRVTLEALALRASEAAAEGVPIPQALRTAANRLQAAQPSMASVANACAYVLHPLALREASALTSEDIHQLVVARSQAFLDAIDRAQQTVVEVGARVVQDGDRKSVV